MRKLAAMITPVFFLAALVSPHPAAAQSAGGEFDQQFMGKMIPHHQMGVDMAKDCVARAAHDELKGLCRKIVSDQEKESGTMRSWLDAWYKGQRAGGPSEAMMKQSQLTMAQMKKLSGTEYEVRFMNEMSKHHRQALKDSQECMRRASHAELKNLCTAMSASQTQQIEQMHGWLCSWHKDCHPAQAQGGR